MLCLYDCIISMYKTPINSMLDLKLLKFLYEILSELCGHQKQFLRKLYFEFKKKIKLKIAYFYSILLRIFQWLLN